MKTKQPPIQLWYSLKREFKHLIDCPHRGQEFKNIFDRGYDYMHRHGELMFLAGTIMGSLATLSLVLVWNIFRTYGLF